MKDMEVSRGRAGDFWLGAAPYKFVGGTLTSASASFSYEVIIINYSFLCFLETESQNNQDNNNFACEISNE